MALTRRRRRLKVLGMEIVGSKPWIPPAPIDGKCIITITPIHHLEDGTWVEDPPEQFVCKWKKTTSEEARDA